MAQKKDDKLFIFWILGIGGLAYAVYNYFSKGNANATSGNTADVSKVPSTVVAKGQTYSPYQMRIQYLQSLIGVKVDGFVGKQTTGQLTEMYLGKLTYGDIAPENIEKYINEIETHNTPYEKKIKADALYTAKTIAKDRSEKIISAYKSNGNFVLYSNPKTSNNGKYQVYEVVYDNVNGIWSYVNTWTIGAGKYTRDGAVPTAVAPNYGNGLVVRLNISGTYRYFLWNPQYILVVSGTTLTNTQKTTDYSSDTLKSVILVDLGMLSQLIK